MTYPGLQLLNQPSYYGAPSRTSLFGGGALGWFSPPSPTAGTLAEPNRNSNTYATDTLARITRERYSDYMRRFRGIENEQIAYATDRTKPLTEARNAIDTVRGSFDALPGMQQRRNARLGLDPAAPDVAASLNRSTNIAGGLAAVTAANRASQQTYDRQNAIFSGAGGQSIPRLGGGA